MSISPWTTACWFIETKVTFDARTTVVLWHDLAVCNHKFQFIICHGDQFYRHFVPLFISHRIIASYLYTKYEFSRDLCQEQSSPLTLLDGNDLNISFFIYCTHVMMWMEKYLRYSSVTVCLWTMNGTPIISHL